MLKADPILLVIRELGYQPAMQEIKLKT